MNIINKSVLSELEAHIPREKFIHNIKTFMDHMPVQIEDLHGLTGLGDMRAVADKAHMLKGTCGQFGAMRLHELFKSIELSANEGRLRDVRMTVRALPYEFQLVQELISMCYMQPDALSGERRVPTVTASKAAPAA
ncbi:MAG TPA: Hpt domain-containing protein [Bacteroidota bacterium]|nr:Hpt domain-containing protein [Bacteroidota bacterium]